MMPKACSKHLFAEPRLTLTPLLAHHARWDCPVCDRFLGWEAKPENADKKRRKPQDHLRWIFEEESIDYCQLCLRQVHQLPEHGTLHVHHIIEVQNGGEPSRNNLMLLCNACHELVYVVRKYASIPDALSENESTAEAMP